MFSDRAHVNAASTLVRSSPAALDSGNNGKSSWLILACATTWFCASTFAAASDAAATERGKTSAAVDIAIIIPAVLRILENEHPLTLVAAPAEPHTSLERLAAVQKITVVSTLKKGFCMDLRLGRGDIAHWTMSLQSTANVWLESAVSGYRLCTGRPGRHLLTLQHAFSWPQPTGQRVGAANEMTWPVHVSISAP